MVNDVRRRAPFYASDWLDAWDYRVVPATVYMYFAKYVYGFSLLWCLFFLKFFGLITGIGWAVDVEYLGNKKANGGINRL